VLANEALFAIRLKIRILHMRNLLEQRTRCLLVQSKFSTSSFWNYVDVCKIIGAKYPAAPLGLMTVAALLPKQWTFKLVDANVEPVLDEHFEWADIICTGGMLPQQRGILSIIEKAHRKGRPVVVGGPDPTSQPDLYQSADYLVLGEGERTIPLFVEDLERNCRSGKYVCADAANMTGAVTPRFDLIQFKNYIHVGVQYSRGCPFNCEFCDIIELYGRIPRAKTPEQIIHELQTLFDLGYRGHVDFVDDNFIGNKKGVKDALKAIIEWSRNHRYPFYFSTEASINIADDGELLRLMRDADFRYVFIGIETPENDILRTMNKHQNVNKPIPEAIRKISSCGMIVNGGFIIGFDSENGGTAETMIKCIQDSGICMAMLGLLYALPNTQLTRRLRREGRLFKESSTLQEHRTNIDQLTSGLNFATKRHRADILKDLVQIVENIYSPKQYFRRATRTACTVKPSAKHRPGMMKKLRKGIAFLKLCCKLGLNRRTGTLYWRMFFTVLYKNPRAIEPAVNLAAMFLHFQKQSRFIVDFTNKEIRDIERCGEEHYNQRMLQRGSGSNHHDSLSTAAVIK
jgi:radical SAM superfamily enzyme YgiQ (UPF0313 family)